MLRCSAGVHARCRLGCCPLQAELRRLVSCLPSLCLAQRSQPLPASHLELLQVGDVSDFLGQRA